MLDELFSRRLLFVSGKGGVGKTTVAAALASAAAREKKRVLILSTDGRGDAASLFGREDAGYVETELEPHLFALTAEFEPLLDDFVRSSIPLTFVQDRILASQTFRYFTRATPGLPELLALGKVRHLLFKRERRGAKIYDLVVVDAPATGHALSLLALPRTLLATIPAGPLRKLASDVDALFSDPERASLVAVAEPAELASREAEELIDGAKEKAGLATSLLVVNRVGRSGGEERLPRAPASLVKVPEIDREEGDDVAFFERFRSILLGEAKPARSAQRPPASGAVLTDTFEIDSWLDTSRLIVLTGPGGVGKTTLAAAVGIAAARRGRRVLVLTVDPARRLAQTLGLGGRVDAPVRVSFSGGKKGGSLSALQIDPKATFERLLPRIAPEAVVDRVKKNRMYAGFVDALPGVLEYMGVEALAQHAGDPNLDLIVLDTPPAARGLDFLAAPDRMIELLEHDALRWFTRRDSLLSRAISGASRGAAAVLKLADRALGFGFLADLADFFHAFEGLYDGFKERSLATREQLSKGRFLVVVSPDRSPLKTAEETARALQARGVECALVLNRVSPQRRLRPLPGGLASLPRKTVAEVSARPQDLPEALADLLG